MEKIRFTFNERYEVSIWPDLMLIKDGEELIYKGPSDELDMRGVISLIQDYRRKACINARIARDR